MGDFPTLEARCNSGLMNGFKRGASSMMPHPLVSLVCLIPSVTPKSLSKEDIRKVNESFEKDKDKSNYKLGKISGIATMTLGYSGLVLGVGCIAYELLSSVV